MIVRETARESDPARPGVASGQISPTRIIPATTQNIGWLNNALHERELRDRQAEHGAPAIETAVMYIHSGEPKRGTTFRVSSGFLIASSRPPGSTGGSRFVKSLSGSVTGNHT